jgi:long-chain acyl-CoA synthetase
MFHCYGLTTGLINPLFCAATIIVVTRFEAASIVDLLERERPTIFPMVPAICTALCDEIERREKKPTLRSIRVCISGAAPLAQDLAERFERLTGTRVVEGYGLSETSPVTHANLLAKPRYGTIGLPMPDTLCRIESLDGDGHEAPIGQPGELLVAGPQIMRGYFANPDETHKAFWTDPQGREWFRTGDIVRMDEDGYFQIIDRKKDMIIRSGLKVYPAKVERVLMMHERIGDAAVIGRPDAMHTEEVVACVVLKSPAPEATDAVADDLRSFCRQHLAAYEVPSRIEFVKQIPRSVLGKVLKQELRQTITSPNSAPRKPDKEAA